MQRVDIDDIVEVGEGLIAYYQGERFTGEAIEKSPSGDIIGLITYRDGIEEGPQWSSHPNGQRSGEGTVHNGKAIGVWKDWYPNGQLKTCTEFNEHGQPVFE